MNYTAPDFSDAVIQQLTAVGYRVHQGLDDARQDLGFNAFWWLLDEGRVTGDTFSTALEAWASALAHALVTPEPATQPVPLDEPAQALQDGRTDRQELILLRISLARVAQALAVHDTAGPPITYGMNYAEIHHVAQIRERGWNALCAAMIDRAHELQPPLEIESAPLLARPL